MVRAGLQAEPDRQEARGRRPLETPVRSPAPPVRAIRQREGEQARRRELPILDNAELPATQVAFKSASWRDRFKLEIKSVLEINPSLKRKAEKDAQATLTHLLFDCLLAIAATA